jgi:asparaginyl-tRNA synthetase
VQGWVRTRRDSKDFSFIELNDGSTLRNLQIIAKDTLAELLGCATALNWSVY